MQWAENQKGLAIALLRLGEREGGTTRFEEAVRAYHATLQELTRERAATQANLGNALRALGERESGTARLEEAVAAWNAFLEVAASAWPSERVRPVETRRDETLAEIARRSGKSGACRSGCAKPANVGAARLPPGLSVHPGTA